MQPLQHTRTSLQHERTSLQHTRTSLLHTRMLLQHTRTSLQHTRTSLQHTRTPRHLKKDLLCRRKIGIFHCATVLHRQVSKECTDLDLSLLYIVIIGTRSKFARQNYFLALGACFLQTCSSAGRMFAASRSCLDYYRHIDSFPHEQIR